MQFGKYRHYKGNMCEVLNVVRNSETLEEMVLYKEFGNKDFGDAMWVRPKKMFLEEIEIDGKMVKRFEYIGDL